MSGDSSPEEAARDAEILARLMPGFWQVRTTLAWAYVSLGAYEAALRAAAAGIQLAENAAAGGEANVLQYVSAVAYERLGRTDEAIRAAELSLRQRRNSPAQELLDRLTATPASDAAP
ncbi:MAG: hypothetical protein IIA54_08985 [Chloroflexi bacterium]|nr:hypothetical protein [Chloroflexota bacterium]